MNIDNNVKEFWEDKHRIGDVAALSGCFYDETIDFLRLRDYIVSGVTVLEVGVGLGYVTKGLFDNGVRVSALDISENSLNRVQLWCDNVFNIKHINDLPTDYFDVIICNNVVQHVSTDLLIEELKELLRSLKSSGVFAVEFVSAIGFDDNGMNPNLSEIQNGGLCRTPKFLEGIFNNLGGTCTLVFDNKVDIGIVQGHHVFHVRK
jgi:SAM-dependent methyltransferase